MQTVDKEYRKYCKQVIKGIFLDYKQMTGIDRSGISEGRCAGYDAGNV